MKYTVTTDSWKETFSLGREVGKFLKKGDIVLLWGQLGAGKTVFVKGVSASKNIDYRTVDSASFVLLKIYENKEKIFHYDFFRLGSSAEIEDLGFFEYADDGISLVEWPSYMREMVKGFDILEVFLEHVALNKRKISISSSSKRFKGIINRVRAKRDG